MFKWIKVTEVGERGRRVRDKWKILPVCPIFPIIFEGTNFRKIDQNSRNSRNQSYFHENWFPHGICSLKIFCYVDMRYSFPKKKKNTNERYKALIKKQQKEAAIPWCSPEKLRNTSQNHMENINNGYIFKYGCRVTSKKGLHKVIGTPLGKYLITQIALTSLFKSFQTNVPFIYPLKKSENQRLSDDFGRYRNWTFESIAVWLLEAAFVFLSNTVWTVNISIFI